MQRPYPHRVFTNVMGESDRGKALEAEVVEATKLKLMSILSATLQPSLYWFIHSFNTCEQDRKA